MKIPFFGKKEVAAAPKAEKPKSARAQIKAITADVERKHREAVEKVERMEARCKALGAA